MTTPTTALPVDEGTSGRRVAVVTGGSGGIGTSVAERLAADGTTVVVHYAGNRERAQEVVDRITAAGGEATALGADVADEEQVAQLFDTVEQTYGGVDVVVHTAGVMLLSPLVDLDLASTSPAPSSSWPSPPTPRTRRPRVVSRR